MRESTPATAAASRAVIISDGSAHSAHHTGRKLRHFPMNHTRSVSTVISILFFVLKLPPFCSGLRSFATLNAPLLRLAADTTVRAALKSSEKRSIVSQLFLKAFMSNSAKHFYEFGPFRIDVGNRLLLRDGEPLPLTPKAVDTLL